MPLTTDTRRSGNGFLIVRGKTGHEDLQMETRKVWLLADPKVILSVTSPQAEKIKFTDGGLYSD